MSSRFVNKIIFKNGSRRLFRHPIHQHKHTNDFLNNIIAVSLFPAITFPTRITEFTATLIDNILCNVNCSSGIVYEDFPDHFPIFVKVKFDKPDVSDVVSQQLSRLFNKTNYNRFSDLMKDVDWNNYTEDSNYHHSNYHQHPEAVFDKFHDDLLAICK